MAKDKGTKTNGQDGLEQHTTDSSGAYLTTSTGVRINHTDDSLKAGKRGPTIMEDFHFREKMTHFDHERIPERVVHARGSGAHGYFQVYKPIPELCKAEDRKSTRLNSSHVRISYAVFCLKKKSKRSTT